MKVTMERSKRYRVHYRIHGLHRVPHVFIGTYLGESGEGTSRIAQFSLRPVSGTSTVHFDYLISAEEVANTVPHANPKRAR